MKGRYPLDALQQIRRGAADERARALADQTRRTEQARVVQRTARDRRTLAEQQVEEQRLSEEARLEAGRQRAADLQAEAAWQVAEQDRIRSLAQREQQAAAATAESERAEAGARPALATAEAEARAVEKHRERWQAERNRAGELAEEDAAVDGWSARRQGDKR